MSNVEQRPKLYSTIIAKVIDYTSSDGSNYHSDDDEDNNYPVAPSTSQRSDQTVTLEQCHDASNSERFSAVKNSASSTNLYLPSSLSPPPSHGNDRVRRNSAGIPLPDRLDRANEHEDSLRVNRRSGSMSLQSKPVLEGRATDDSGMGDSLDPFAMATTNPVDALYPSSGVYGQAGTVVIIKDRYQFDQNKVNAHIGPKRLFGLFASKTSTKSAKTTPSASSKDSKKRTTLFGSLLKSPSPAPIAPPFSQPIVRHHSSYSVRREEQ